MARVDVILRVRVKNWTEIPPEARCCETMRSQLQAWAVSGYQLRIVAGRRKRNCKCLACGSKFTGSVVAGMKGWYIDPRAWDIEEAPEA